MKNTHTFFTLVFILLIAAVHNGCVNSNNTSGVAPTPTPVLYPAVFHVNNNTLSAVTYVGLVRNSTSQSSYSNCNIPGGYSVNVTINIPASDTYNVTIGAGPGYSNDVWNVYSIAVNTTYTANIQGASSSLSTTACNVCQF